MGLYWEKLGVEPDDTRCRVGATGRTGYPRDRKRQAKADPEITGNGGVCVFKPGGQMAQQERGLGHRVPGVHGTARG